MTDKEFNELMKKDLQFIKDSVIKGIKNIMDIYDKLRKKIAVNDINDAFLVKKFLHDIPLMGALGFLRRLKNLSKDSNLAKFQVFNSFDKVKVLTLLISNFP